LVGLLGVGASSLGLDVKRDEMNCVDREDGVEVKLILGWEGGVKVLGSLRIRFCGLVVSSGVMTSEPVCAFRFIARLTFSLCCELNQKSWIHHGEKLDLSTHRPPLFENFLEGAPASRSRFRTMSSIALTIDHRVTPFESRKELCQQSNQQNKVPFHAH